MQRFYAAAALLLFACGTAIYLWRGFAVQASGC
jgi:hypothetical protein